MPPSNRPLSRSRNALGLVLGLALVAPGCQSREETKEDARHLARKTVRKAARVEQAAHEKAGEVWTAVEPALHRLEDRVRDDMVPRAKTAARDAAREAGKAARSAEDAARKATQPPPFQPIPGTKEAIDCGPEVCEIDHPFIQGLGQHADALWTHGQVVPNFTRQGVTGLRVINVHPDGVLGALGLAHDDVIEAVDGTPVRSIQDILALRDQLRGRSEVDITVRRGTTTWTKTLRAVLP